VAIPTTLIYGKGGRTVLVQTIITEAPTDIPSMMPSMDPTGFPTSVRYMDVMELLLPISGLIKYKASVSQRDGIRKRRCCDTTWIRNIYFDDITQQAMVKEEVRMEVVMERMRTTMATITSITF
jgi:hypothetical protein